MIQRCVSRNWSPEVSIEELIASLRLELAKKRGEEGGGGGAFWRIRLHCNLFCCWGLVLEVLLMSGGRRSPSEPHFDWRVHLFFRSAFSAARVAGVGSSSGDASLRFFSDLLNGLLWFSSWFCCWFSCCCDLNLSAAELMQYRFPVGLGPSSKRWPRCLPQWWQVTSVLTKSGFKARRSKLLPTFCV